MKKLIILIFAIVVFLINNSYSENNIYFIDFDKILNNSTLGKKY